MSRKMTRVLVALLLLVTFTAGAAPAAPRSLADDREVAPMAALWEWITAWFQSSTVEEGPHMDPDGLTAGEEGPHMDPNG